MSVIKMEIPPKILQIKNYFTDRNMVMEYFTGIFI